MKTWLLSLVVASACLFAACSGDANGAPVIVTTPTPPPSGAPTQPAGEGETPSGEAPTEAPTEPSENGETPGNENPGETTEPSGGNGSDSTPTPDDAVVVACGDILAPVDKRHRLPADCAPGDLVALPEAYSAAVPQYMRAEAADAAVRLFEAAIADGVYIYAISSYRSYQDQVFTYEYHVGNLGEEEAARVSARPGHSEHQLGTTTDVVSASSGYTLDGFVGTPEADWVAENAWRYGFVVSYPAGMESVTGYVYEPWHIRYVGEDVAADVQNSGMTLGEYLHSR